MATSKEKLGKRKKLSLQLVRENIVISKTFRTKFGIYINYFVKYLIIK